LTWLSKSVNENGSIATVAVHRHGRRETDGHDARYLFKAPGDLLVCQSRLLRILDERPGNRHPERLDLLGPHEAGVDLLQGYERSNHQPRDDQQHESQGDLRHRERVADPVPARRVAG
jgi:hypothetical protein